MPMKQLLLAAALTVAIGAGARADTIDLLRSGRWTAFGGTDVDGNEVCGMSTHWPDGRSFLIKRYEGNDKVVVQAIKTGWRLTYQNADISLKIGDNSAWTASAAVVDGRDGLEFTISVLKSVDFFKELNSSDEMTLTMGDNHVAWVMNLDGGDSVSAKFWDCVKIMSK